MLLAFAQLSHTFARDSRLPPCLANRCVLPNDQWNPFVYLLLLAGPDHYRIATSPTLYDLCVYQAGIGKFYIGAVTSVH